MKKIYQKKVLEGRVKLTKNFSKHLFLAEPHGIINPTLLEEDLRRAKEFSSEVSQDWTYCTNASDVRLVNPLNLFYLKEIKKLARLKQIVIFAPGLINRLLIFLASPIVRPDRIFKERQQFEKFLATVH